MNNQVTTSITAPLVPLEGDVWFDNSDSNNIITRIWNGNNAWETVGGISKDANNALITGTDNGAFFNVNAIVKVVTTNYTLLATDNGNVITVDSAGDVNLTIPDGLGIGFNVSVYQIGTGTVTLVSDGTNLRNRLNRFKTAGRNAGIGVLSTAMNIFHITGDLTL